MFTFFFTRVWLFLSLSLISLYVLVATTRIKVSILTVQSHSLFSPFINDFTGATLGEFLFSLFFFLFCGFVFDLFRWVRLGHGGFCVFWQVLGYDGCLFCWLLFLNRFPIFWWVCIWSKMDVGVHMPTQFIWGTHSLHLSPYFGAF